MPPNEAATTAAEAQTTPAAAEPVVAETTHAMVTTTEQPMSMVGRDDYMMPQDIDQAIRLAQFLSKASMLPKDYIDKPGNVLLAIQMGAELGLKPTQAIQNIAVIGARPGLFGDAGKALLIKHGCRIKERASEEVKSLEMAECTITRPGFDAVTRTFSKADAVTAKLWGKDGPWTNYPYRQMAWRAFWWAARDIAPDILKGMGGAEEVQDIELHEKERDVTSSSTVERTPRVAQPTARTNGEAKPKDDEAAKTPASDGMKKHIEKRMIAADVKIEPLCERFPDVKLDFAGLTVAQANAILEWLTNGAKA